jgi:hypothetical protein
MHSCLPSRAWKAHSTSWRNSSPPSRRSRSDLIEFLGAVDSKTEAGSKNVVNAGVALASTIEMLRAITDKATKEGGLLMPASRRLGTGDPKLRYQFYIEECSIVQDGSPQNGALLVTLVGARPVGVGMPWVHVGDASYKAERYLGNVPAPVRPATT